MGTFVSEDNLSLRKQTSFSFKTAWSSTKKT